MHVYLSMHVCAQYKNITCSSLWSKLHGIACRVFTAQVPMYMQISEPAGTQASEQTIYGCMQTDLCGTERVVINSPPIHRPYDVLGKPCRSHDCRKYIGDRFRAAEAGSCHSNCSCRPTSKVKLRKVVRDMWIKWLNKLDCIGHLNTRYIYWPTNRLDVVLVKSTVYNVDDHILNRFTDMLV